MAYDIDLCDSKVYVSLHATSATIERNQKGMEEEERWGMGEEREGK